MTSEKPRRPLGELLKEKGLITAEHIEFVLQEQKITRERMGEILERLCFVTEYELEGLSAIVESGVDKKDCMFKNESNGGVENAVVHSKREE